VTELAHRVGTLDVLVTGPDGPLPHHRVTVEQVRHQFGFGNIGSELIDHANGALRRTPGNSGQAADAGTADESDLADAWLALFDQVTLPFYWRGMEPTPGEPHTELLLATHRLLGTAKWFAEHGVRVKGHPLLWHTLAPTWLLAFNDVQAERIMRDRITREVTFFKGVIDHWDVINEAVILPRFTAETNAVTRLAQTRGRVGMVKLAFETARAANPGARLVLNDFLLTEEYEQLIADCLDAGISIDAIGLQSHMHQGFRGEDELGAILERFGRFGLPLELTETTLVSGHLMPPEIEDLNDYQVESWPSTPESEERQASELVRHYLTCLAHPAVESITYWGLRDGDMWLGAPAGLIHADGTPKPAYEALHGLVRGDWWLDPTELVTDAEGRLRLQGWGGEYRVSSQDAHADVTITAGAEGATTVSF